jgi:hypothetical protein
MTKPISINQLASAGFLTAGALFNFGALFTQNSGAFVAIGLLLLPLAPV